MNTFQRIKVSFEKYIEIGSLFGKFTAATAGFISISVLALTIINFRSLEDKIYSQIIKSLYKDEHLVESLRAGVNWKSFEEQVGVQPTLIDQFTAEDKKTKYIENIYANKNYYIQMVRKEEAQNVLFYTVSQINKNFQPKHLSNTIKFDKTIRLFEDYFYKDESPFASKEPNSITESRKLESGVLKLCCGTHYYWQEYDTQTGFGKYVETHKNTKTQKYIILGADSVTHYFENISKKEHLIPDLLTYNDYTPSEVLKNFRDNTKVTIYGEFDTDFIRLMVNEYDFINFNNPIKIGIEVQKRAKLAKLINEFD